MFNCKKLYTYFSQIKTVKPKYIVWLLILGCTIFFSWYTILRHYAFQTSAGDLGFYEQSFWSTLHGRLFYTTVWEYIGNTPFAHHFQPMLFLLLPIYAIYQSPETLLVLQSFFLALAALPLYWIAKKKMGETGGVVFAALYLMYPALHGINQFDFHVEIFAISFLLFSFHYAEEKQYPRFLLFAFLALICKEDVALTLVVLSLYILWTNRKDLKEKRINSKGIVFPTILILISLLWFFISIRVVVPYFNKSTEYIFLRRFYPSFVDTYNPIPDLLYDWDKKILLFVLLLFPLEFLPFLSPSIFFITLPAFATIIFGRYPHAYAIGYQYSYAIIPFLFVSTLYGVKRLKLSEKALKKFLALMLCVGLISILLMGLTPLLLGGTTPYNGLYKGIPRMTFHEKALYKILALIPENESVSTQNNIFPHLCHRFNVHLGYSEGVSYVLLDRKYDAPEFLPEHLPLILDNYGLVASVDQILLYKRGYEGDIYIPFNHGLMAQFYNNIELEGTSVFKSVVFNTNFDWGYNSPYLTVNSDNFSVVFEGYLQVSETGDYTFNIQSDDGHRLFFNGDVVLNNWGNGVFNDSVTVNLKEGYNHIKLEYMEGCGSASIRLYWKAPSMNSFESIQEENFYLFPPT